MASVEMRDKILAANPTDVRLYDYVADTFDERMRRVSRFIAGSLPAAGSRPRRRRNELDYVSA